MSTRTQVLLQRPSDRPDAPPGAVVEDVFWIDSTLARRGRRVRDEDDRVWTVAAVYSTRAVEDVQKVRGAQRALARKLEDHS